MKKKISIVVLCFIAILGFFSTGFYSGEKYMTNKRGPGPDFDIQQGISQPTINSGLRSYGSSLGVLLFGSNFDDSSNPLAQGFVTTLGGNSSVDIATDIVDSGEQSLILTTGAVSGNMAGIYRYGPTLGAISRYGLAISVFPDVPASGSALSTLTLNLWCNFYGMGRDFSADFVLWISRQAGGVKKLYYRNAAGVQTDTGISNIDDLFMANTDSLYQQFWHRIKFVVDPTKATPTYGFLEIDGHQIDLSMFTAPTFTTAPNYQQRNYYQAYVVFNTDENIAKVMHLDNFAITVFEP